MHSNTIKNSHQYVISRSSGGHRALLLLLVMSALALTSCSSMGGGMPIEDEISRAANGAHRSKANIDRNIYRHPVETLTFFGLQDDMTVIEALPGGLWYSEILGPVLLENGTYRAAGIDASLPGVPDYALKRQIMMEERLAAEPEVFGNVEVVKLSAPNSIELGEPGSADMVLTFRSMHGWIRAGVAEQVMAGFFEVLKPGGVLGVVQHRAGPESNPDPEAFIGYVAEDRVIGIVESAGFRLEEKSEINANPSDKANYAKGVWTLPPSLMLKDEDREKYLLIGESDRMTLRFRKPE